MAERHTERAWRDFHAGLRAFVSRRVRQPADADDIVQHVFLQLHRSLPTVRDVDRLSAWLYQTARRAIADYYRAPASRERPSGAALDLAAHADHGSAAPEAASPTAADELAACLRPLVGRLADDDREALRLVEIEDLTQAEAARRLGLSVSGMKSRVQRARARLRLIVEACCQVELDRRGGVVAYARRDAGCGRCAPERRPAPGRPPGLVPATTAPRRDAE